MVCVVEFKYSFWGYLGCGGTIFEVVSISNTIRLCMKFEEMSYLKFKYDDVCKRDRSGFCI